jgi:hypothetical protein
VWRCYPVGVAVMAVATFGGAMSTVLSVAVIALSLALAVWTVVVAVRAAPIRNSLLIGLAALEVLLLAQLVVGIVLLATGDRPGSTVTFVAYLVGLLFVVPVGTLWAVAEKSRPSTLVLTVACLAVPVMTGRLLQMWDGVG